MLPALRTECRHWDGAATGGKLTLAGLDSQIVCLDRRQERWCLEAMDSNNLSEPVHEPEGVSPSRGGRPDLLLSLARSQKEHGARLVLARKMKALVVVGAVVAATSLWLADRDSAYRGDGKLPEPARARSKIAAAAELATAQPPGAKPHPSITALPGNVIQLGAYQSREQAERAWTTLATRFPSLRKMDKLILPFAGGVRLRAAAHSAGEATQACAALKGAGEGCFMPR